MDKKTNATILGIIYHPEIRDILSEQGKVDIAEMVQILADSLSGNCEYDSARGLAINIWKKFYKIDAPEFEPLDDLMGVISQIDHMTCGLSRVKP